MANKTAKYEFTIIVPVYNEVDNIYNLENVFSKYLPACSRSACVLFVNDGSKDGSLEKIKEICSRNEGFFFISFEKNAGLTAAIKAGFEYVESPLAGYIDADLQTSPEDFEKLLPEIDSYSMVLGIRAKRKDTLFYRFQSKFGNWWRKLFTKDGATDTGCPLKVFHSDFARKYPLFKGLHRFFPALTLMMGGTYKQVPVRHFPRQTGQSKFNVWNRMWSGAVDCFEFVYMRKRYLRYKVGEDNIS